MITRFALFILALVLTFSIHAQVNYHEHQKVLENNIVDSLFIFGKWANTGDTETHIKYLGKVTTSSGRVLKIMNSCWFWGLSHRATSRILIYNDKNQYLGNYYLTMTSDLPYKLDKGKLFFSNKGKEDCNKKIITAIDFSRGIPKTIFLKCNGSTGDIYTFSSE